MKNQLLRGNLQQSVPCTARPFAVQVIQVIDGEAELTIPPNSQPGQQLVLKGRGARVLGDASAARGDHVVTLRVRHKKHERYSHASSCTTALKVLHLEELETQRW